MDHRRDPFDPPQPVPVAGAPKIEARCATCGTSVPRYETECAFCTLEKLPRTAMRTLLLHWLVFIVAMGVIIGGGYLLGR